MQACPAHALREDAAKLGLSAEKMLAPGNVQKQAIRRIDHHGGAEAVAILGDAIKQGGIRTRVHFLDPQIGNAGAGVRQRHAYGKPCPLCIRADRHEALGAFHLLGDDKRQFRRLVASPDQPICR